MNIIRISRTRDQRKRRVAAYCRVSTLLEEQEDSIETQLSYYQSFISSHSDWDFAGIYSDEKSGLDAEKRKGFQQMIKDALDGEIDYILVKSVSRFSRNVVDCQRYVNILHGNGIDIYFEKENINTADQNSSMLLSIMSAFAQNESKSISENVKWAIRERFKRGEYNLGNNCSNRMLGYDSIGGKLIPNKDAAIVRVIFSLFLEGRTVADIRKLLTSKGVVGKSGKPITESGIMYILTNETYVGDKLLQKKAPINMLTKQHEKGRPFESNYLVDDHEGIVTRAMWEATQRKLQMKKAEIEELQQIASSSSSAVSAQTVATMAMSAGIGESVAGAEVVGSSPMASYGSKTPMFGKIICGDCGSLMKRKTYKGREGNYKVWACKTPKGSKLLSQQEEAQATDTASIIKIDVEALNEADRLDTHSDYDCYSPDAYDDGRIYCSIKSVKETDIIAEILRQAGQEPEQPEQASASKGTASKRGGQLKRPGKGLK